MTDFEPVCPFGLPFQAALGHGTRGQQVPTLRLNNTRIDGQPNFPARAAVWSGGHLCPRVSPFAISGCLLSGGVGGGLVLLRPRIPRSEGSLKPQKNGLYFEI